MQTTGLQINKYSFTCSVGPGESFLRSAQPSCSSKYIARVDEIPVVLYTLHRQTDIHQGAEATLHRLRLTDFAAEYECTGAEHLGNQ